MFIWNEVVLVDSEDVDETCQPDSERAILIRTAQSPTFLFLLLDGSSGWLIVGV
jgi:hypothetical protein